ncbi:hypothetical protein [Streptomyces sp. CAU 1734]|uniref:hypothetical protein n=1 Tax=Streptomyces sp. CAU 1734 TaxID=3140360 RepID=UPI003260C64E
MTKPHNALAAFGALLDQSLAELSEASSDARTFDRQRVVRVSDVWDNNTWPLFRSATARTRWGRERRARAALRWMAGMGAERAAWMAERTAAAGYPVQVPCKEEPEGPARRDFTGRVYPRPVEITPAAATDVAGDYALGTAEVRALSVERAGSRLDGVLCLAVERAYSGGHPEAARAELLLFLTDIGDLRFDSDHSRGAALMFGAGGISVRLGARGVLSAASGTLRLEDSEWHLSAAGRRADAVTPPSGGRKRARWSRRERELEPAAGTAARLLREGMWEIRAVRYAEYARPALVRGFCRAFEGAGAAILAAGAHRTARGRDAAFRELVGTWRRQGGAAFARRADGPEGGEGPGTAASPPAPAPGAALRMVSYTAAANSRYDGSPVPASVLVQLALPRRGAPAAGPWALSPVMGRGAVRVRVLGEAFEGMGRPWVIHGTGTDGAFGLGDGALVVEADLREE